MNNPISVYAVNLAARTERRASIEEQFAGRDDFDFHIVPGIEHKNGPWGLWQTFYGIVEREAAKGTDYFVFCEDDHVFTSAYSPEFLKQCISEAQSMNAELLSGGVSVMDSPMQASPHLYWISHFNGMQFTVIFKSLYDSILACKTEKGYVTDIHLSHLAKRKFVMFPYISIQREFGYSDATLLNSEEGRVSHFFEKAQARLSHLSKIKSHYSQITPDTIRNIWTVDVSKSYVPTYVINLNERKDRLEHIRRQFDNHPEFDVHIVEAETDENGAVGLWRSICKIIRSAKEADEDFILICEDDHIFTSHYEASSFLHQVMLAGAMNADMLNGGIGGFGNLVPLCAGLAWVDWFWCTQFIVVYRRAYDAILNAPFSVRDVADGKLSELLKNKFVITPFISEQTDFGYSDITEANNNNALILQHFDHARIKLHHYFALSDNNSTAAPLSDSSFAGLPHKAIQLGCGENLLPGWVNTDVEPSYGVTFLDATQRWNISDNSLDYIFAEHLIEWLEAEGIKDALHECFRTLKPGGMLRLTLFSPEKIMKEPSVLTSYAQWWRQQVKDNIQTDDLFATNLFYRRMAKLYVLDFESLRSLLSSIGFTSIRICQPQVSEYEYLRGVEKHKYYTPTEIQNMETMVLEASK